MNFGPFRGHTKIDLTPTDSQNIILLGGLNGAGKTTLLEALKIVLFGKLLKKGANNSTGYDSILKGYMNNTSKDNRTFIELDFKLHRRDTNTYRIRRSWSLSEHSKVNENFFYKRISYNENGEELINELVVEGMNWYSTLEEIFPPQVANLFLFDGEQIEKMADPRNTTRMLEKSLDVLFGGGTLSQLGKDLHFLEKELLRSQAEDSNNNDFKNEIHETQKLEDLIQSLTQKQESLLKEIQTLNDTEESLRENLRMMGGEFYHKREEYEERIKLIQKTIFELNDALIGLFNQELPFLMVKDLINGIVDSSTDAIDFHDVKAVGHLIDIRDKKIIESLEQCALENSVLSTIKNLFKDIPIPTDKVKTTPYTHQELVESKKVLSCEANTKIELGAIFDKYCTLKKELDHLKNVVSQMPAPEKAQPIINQLNILLEKRKSLINKNENINNEIKQNEQLAEKRRTAILRFAEQYYKEISDSETTVRMRDRLTDVTSTLKTYKKTLLERKLEQIQTISLDLFNALHRKSGFIQEIKIDPVSLEINLKDDSDYILPITQISAGERQMLMTSLIWAIAKASGRSLPFIIDTPLGRLDSNHRDRLLTKFYPIASHQVVLLSTDQEISENEYLSLGPFISKEYEIRYDSEAKGSTISTVYPYKYSIKRKDGAVYA
jgi:DNA sulfur modification protein DndD